MFLFRFLFQRAQLITRVQNAPCTGAGCSLKARLGLGLLFSPLSGWASSSETRPAREGDGEAASADEPRAERASNHSLIKWIAILEKEMQTAVMSLTLNLSDSPLSF